MGPVDLVEPPQKILGRTIDIITARVVRKIRSQGRPTQLSLEQVDLVEEENDARPREPPRIHDGVKKDQTFHHAILPGHCKLFAKMTSTMTGCPYLITFLQQYLIVLTQRYAEDDGRDIFEAMNPLLSFASLSTDIKHAAGPGSVWGP